MLRFAAAVAPLALIASPVAADVVDSSAAGFTVSKSVSIAATPDVVWATLVAPQYWWSKEHTWSGNSANLYIEDKVPGCFCEFLPALGKVVHARPIFVQRGKMLRMEGALGPLQAYAVTGVISFELSTEDHKVTTLKVTYTVGGYMPGGLEKMAKPVDGVLAEQIDRLKAVVEAPKSGK